MSAPFLAPERDRSFKAGRPKSSGGTTYYTIPGVTISLTTAVINFFGAGTLYYSPFFVEAPLLVDRLAFQVDTADAVGNVRVGIYTADTDLQPKALVVDSGSVSVATTGVKTYTPGSPVYLPRGRYLSVVQSDGTTVTLRQFDAMGTQAIDTGMGGSNNIRRFSKTSTYGALPATGTAWDVANASGAGASHWVFLRVSAA